MSRSNRRQSGFDHEPTTLDITPTRSQRVASVMRRIIIVLLSLLLTMVTSCGAYMGVTWYKAYQTIHDPSLAMGGDLIAVDPSELVLVDPSELGVNQQLGDQWKNILLLGRDARSSDWGNSDTMIIASINTTTGEVKLTSLMRDMRVDIPDKGKKKINAAHAYGGPNLAMKTVNENFNLNITDYATVNFSNLAAIIDGAGGIYLDVTEAERGYINRYIVEQKNVSKNKDQDFSSLANSGENVLLTGHQAVAYSRIRAIGNDYQRTERQRNVLQALFAKIKSTNNLLTMADTAMKIIPYIETSMSLPEVLMMGTSILGSGSDEIKQFRIPIDGSYDDTNSTGDWSIIVDFEKNIKALHEFIYGQ